LYPRICGFAVIAALSSSIFTVRLGDAPPEYEQRDEDDHPDTYSPASKFSI
jgi:hypothetical protein